MSSHLRRDFNMYAAPATYVTPATYTAPTVYSAPIMSWVPTMCARPVMAHPPPVVRSCSIQYSAPIQYAAPVQYFVASDASSEELRACDALLKCQEEKLEEIMAELRTNGYKRGHWIWYVFPTDKVGNFDSAETYVTKATVSRVCSNMATAKSWQDVLEYICDLVEADGMRVLPKKDHGRIHWFLKFWTTTQGTPGWMLRVCQRLDKFKWPRE
eukprot:gnl/MRDRNA2_/MRDRNA2_118730_c0_seq1.p1 gnl/MRDRNA2_/MRDRNA2_118730_c0~~gnl/MRDRNA2_/MRDRNA2_118730_c0_seq1.p1  ORF type:complete len:236 (+),score=26.90 gnl/MRDRNA2_/MRDRNA2_118730_c0_seq1:72-710(+)